MTFGLRLAIIAIMPIAGAGVILYNNQFMPSLPGPVATPLADAHGWLQGIAFLYIANFLVAWKWRLSWSSVLIRSLAWALVAYLCISNIIDLFGMHAELGEQIVNFSQTDTSDIVKGLRGQLLVWTSCLAMALTCIGIGFETNRNGTDENGA